MADIREIVEARFSGESGRIPQFSARNILEGAVFVLAFGFAAAVVLGLFN